MGVPKRFIQINDTNTIIQNSKLDVDDKHESVNHSTDIEVNDSTDLVNRITCSINCGCQIKTRYFFTSGLHKNEDEYGKGSIRRRVRVAGYGGARRAADLKFKCVWDSEECTDAIRRTMGVHVRVLAVIGLVLMLLTTSAAAPARSRLGRSTHVEKNAVSVLIYNLYTSIQYLIKLHIIIRKIVNKSSEFKRQCYDKHTKQYNMS